MTLRLQIRDLIPALLLAGLAVHAPHVLAEDAGQGDEAGDGAAPAQPAEGERPRIRYWLQDPQETTPAANDTPAPAKDEGKDEAKAVQSSLKTGRTAEERREAVRAQFKSMIKSAEKAYENKEYMRCVQICRNILTADPSNIEAIKWLQKGHAKLAEADDAVAVAAAERKGQEALLESQEREVRPPVRIPEERPHLATRTDDPSLPGRKKMADRMKEPISVDFADADLAWVFNTLFIMTGINIVADPAAIEDKKLTLHVEDLPLQEVLDFVVRNNDGIQYSVTEHAIWITATSSDDLKKLMKLKVYPIHHGLMTSQGLGNNSRNRQTRTSSGGSGSNSRINNQNNNRGGGGGGGGGGQQGQGQNQGSYLEVMLKWLQDQKDPQTFPDGSQYLIDLQSNQLAVLTTPAGHAKIEEILDAFDQPALQVLIKARFLDIALEKNNALGINVERVNTRVDEPRNPFRTFDLAGTTPTDVLSTLGTGTSLVIKGLRTDPQFSVTLNALLNHRNTRILSEPQILAVNNKEAMIDVTTFFSFITDLREVTTTDFGGDGTSASRVAAFVPEFDQEEVGFTLNVTPSVGRDLKTINLHLKPIIDSLAQGQNVGDFQTFEVVDTEDGTATPPVIKQPVIDTTELETDVVLEDNGYVIIGGLIRNRWETVERKIPGLHRIPGLGHLFKSKTSQRLTSNLVVIVEAQIITPRGRHYHTAPYPDDPDIREGGVNRAPGQVTETRHSPEVNNALGLPAIPQDYGDTARPMSGAVNMGYGAGWQVPQEEPVDGRPAPKAVALSAEPEAPAESAEPDPSKPQPRATLVKP
ncbi:MAG: hypothetical protein L6R28_01095 [Planctomycetes bacterium]|nr:hypothetical protein [Planctomycetota bacterium]